MTFSLPKKDAGFTLFIAIIVTGTILLVSTAIVTLAAKETFLTSANRDSQFAFYAADTGAECAIYWDINNPSGYSAFSTSTGSTINCNQNAANATNPTPPSNQVGGSSVSVFNLTFLPDPYCAQVTVTKVGTTTQIDSLGFNTCDPTNTRRVERAVRAKY